MIRSTILALALALAGCASGPTLQVGASPEAQIAAGAQTVTATVTLATVALRNHVITVPKAKAFQTMLQAAAESLRDANGELVQCRAATGSTAATAPDPCWPKVQDVVTIAVQSITAIRQALPK